MANEARRGLEAGRAHSSRLENNSRDGRALRRRPSLVRYQATKPVNKGRKIKTQTAKIARSEWKFSGREDSKARLEHGRRVAIVAFDGSAYQWEILSFSNYVARCHGFSVEPISQGCEKLLSDALDEAEAAIVA